MMGWLAVLSCAPLIGTRARAFGVAQSGLYAVQGLGILAGGAMAQLIGAPLAMSWTHLRGRLIQATERAGEP